MKCIDLQRSNTIQRVQQSKKCILSTEDAYANKQGS